MYFNYLLFVFLFLFQPDDMNDRGDSDDSDSDDDSEDSEVTSDDGSSEGALDMVGQQGYGSATEAYGRSDCTRSIDAERVNDSGCRL